MNLFSLIVREFIGMFIDDEFLAIAVLIVIAVAAALAYVAKVPSLAVGATLLVGCVLVLIGSVWRARSR